MEGMRRKFSLEEYHHPTYCDKCEAVMVYKGLGEYQCESCGMLDYDDYGKVRNYLDVHIGANVAEISDATGVTHKSIRDMIKENRFKIINNNAGFLRCEMCGENIDSGRLCSKCEMMYHRKLEEEARENRKPTIEKGAGKDIQGDSGSKRFTRDR